MHSIKLFWDNFSATWIDGSLLALATYSMIIYFSNLFKMTISKRGKRAKDSLLSNNAEMNDVYFYFMKTFNL